MSDIVIRAENVSKKYRLGVIGHGTLARDLQSWWARLRGKEDPNTKLDVLQQTRLNSTSGDFWALRDVSFDVKQGEVLGIIGRNGAGKSTFLKILARVTAPTTGSIKVRGRIASLLEVGTGFHPELTGRENVYLNGAILGMTKKEIDRKFEEIVDFSEVEDFIDTPVKRYSSGMYVRLAFAVAAHLDPEILIVDEVLAVGDVNFQKKCFGKMHSISSQGRTVLLVSHQMNAINRLCNRAVLLNEGKVETVGPASEIIKAYLADNTDELKSKRSYEEDTGKKAQILNMEISFNNGTPVDRAIEIRESISLKLEVVLRESIHNLRGAFYFRNASGEIVFFSDITDHDDSVKLTKQSRYKLKADIPAPLLVPGRYTVTAGLSDDTGSLDHCPGAVTFEISDLSSRRTERPGYIYIPLKWSLNNNDN